MSQTRQVPDETPDTPHAPEGPGTGGARVPRAELTGPVARLVSAMARRRLGAVPDGLGVLWHHRRVLVDLSLMGRRTEKWDRLDPLLGGLAAMATAAQVGCGACLDLNYYLAHTRGLDLAKAREVIRWRDSTAFTPLERRVMAYAEAVTATPPAVTDEMSGQLLADLGPDGLIELTARVGYLNLAARSNVALGIPSEHLADACGLPPMAQAG